MTTQAVKFNVNQPYLECAMTLNCLKIPSQTTLLKLSEPETHNVFFIARYFGRFSQTGAFSINLSSHSKPEVSIICN